MIHESGLRYQLMSDEVLRAAFRLKHTKTAKWLFVCGSPGASSGGTCTLSIPEALKSAPGPDPDPEGRGGQTLWDLTVSSSCSRHSRVWCSLSVFMGLIDSSFALINNFIKMGRIKELKLPLTVSSSLGKEGLVFVTFLLGLQTPSDNPKAARCWIILMSNFTDSIMLPLYHTRFLHSLPFHSPLWKHVWDKNEGEKLLKKCCYPLSNWLVLAVALLQKCPLAGVQQWMFLTLSPHFVRIKSNSDAVFGKKSCRYGGKWALVSESSRQMERAWRWCGAIFKGKLSVSLFSDLHLRLSARICQESRLWLRGEETDQSFFRWSTLALSDVAILLHFYIFRDGAHAKTQI